MLVGAETVKSGASRTTLERNANAKYDAVLADEQSARIRADRFSCRGPGAIVLGPCCVSGWLGGRCSVMLSRGRSLRRIVPLHSLGSSFAPRLPGAAHSEAPRQSITLHRPPGTIGRTTPNVGIGGRDTSWGRQKDESRCSRDSCVGFFIVTGVGVVMCCGGAFRSERRLEGEERAENRVTGSAGCAGGNVPDAVHRCPDPKEQRLCIAGNRVSPRGELKFLVDNRAFAV